MIYSGGWNSGSYPRLTLAQTAAIRHSSLLTSSISAKLPSPRTFPPRRPRSPMRREFLLGPDRQESGKGRAWPAQFRKHHQRSQDRPRSRWPPRTRSVPEQHYSRREFDPVAQKIQVLIPSPTSSGTINNYLPTYANPKVTTIPSVKGDSQISAKIEGLGLLVGQHAR